MAVILTGHSCVLYKIGTVICQAKRILMFIRPKMSVSVRQNDSAMYYSKHAYVCGTPNVAVRYDI